MMGCRWLVSVVSAVLVVVLVGCGSDEGGGSQASSGGSSGCTPKHEFSTIKEGTLSVAAYVSPPYTVQASGSSAIEGIDGKIMAEIAKLECLEVDAQSVSGAAAVPSIQAKRMDVGMGGWYRTPERAEILNLSDTIYKDGMDFVAEEEVTSVDGLAGKKVGVVQGYLWNDDLVKVLGKDNVKLYQATDALMSDLGNGRVDVGVLTTSEAAFRVKQKPELGHWPAAADERVAATTAPGEVVFPHTKGNQALTDALNADIAELRANGTIKRILEEAGLPATAGS